MHIMLSIHHELDRNAGAPGVTYRLAREFEKRGYRVTLYSYESLPRWIPSKLKAVAFPYMLCGHLLKHAKQYDVVDASSGDAWLWGILRKAQGGPILVTRSHGLEHTAHVKRLEEEKRGNLKLSWKYPLYHGGLRLWEVAASFRRSTGAFFLNEVDSAYAVRHFKLPVHAVFLVKNGLPEYLLNRPMVNTPYGKDETIRIAQVGSYLHQKGITYTREALVVLMRKYRNLEISFIGTGCNPERVWEDYDPDLKPRIRVVSRYAHEELPDLLKGHHIKLFATLSEGFGLALVEAMACGLAPVTTATAGPLTIVEDGKDAMVIPPHDAGAIMASLEKLIEDRVLLDQMRRLAWRKAQSYSWAHIADEAIEYYRELRRDHTPGMSGGGQSPLTEGRI